MQDMVCAISCVFSCGKVYGIFAIKFPKNDRSHNVAINATKHKINSWIPQPIFIIKYFCKSQYYPQLN